MSLPDNADHPQDGPPTSELRRLRRAGRRRLAVTVGVVGLAGTALTGMATGALFTATQSVGANTFTTGTVAIGVTPVKAALTASNMAPGDSIYGTLVVTNPGTLAHRYSVLSTTDAADNNFLAAQLGLTIKVGVTACTSAGFGLTGTAVYGSGVLGSVAGTKTIGDAATGNQLGDRTLAASASETLCAQVTLPLATGNTYQAKTTTAIFRFDAEQTANNP